MRKTLLPLVLALVPSTGLAQNEEDPRVFFVEPGNGATVGQEFKVVMGVRGMDVKPVGDMTGKTGHHHLMIDSASIKTGEVVPVDDKHLHFGKGQTETTVKLPPGKHELQLQFADGAHRSFGSAMSASIEVTVR
ncbi:MAG TPA: DUF4399 domain-containing protein [Burkholderiales bacterium]